MGVGERSGVEAAKVGAAAHLASDQPGVLERLDVLRGGRERDSEGLGQLADRSLVVGEFAKHPPACGVAEGVKDGIQLRRFKFNHVVEYSCAPPESKPIC